MDLAELRVRVSSEGVTLTARDLDKLAVAARGAGVESDKTGNKFRGATDKMTASSGRLKVIGRDINRYITLPLTLLGAASIKAANDLNNGLGNVQALIPTAPAERINELKDSVRELSAEFGKSFDDINQGLYRTISVFQDGEDTIARLNTAIKAGIAGYSSTADAVQLLSSVTRAYGDTSAKAVDRVSDLAFEAVRLGDTTFPALSSAMQVATDRAVRLGVSQEELFTVMATLTGITGDASMVATQFRSAMDSLLNPTEELTALFAAMGYSSGEAAIEGMGFINVLTSINDAATRANRPLQDFITRKEGITLVSRLATQQLADFNWKLKEITDSTGAANRAFEAVDNGVAKVSRQFMEAKQRTIALMSVLGDKLLPGVVAVVEGFNKMIEVYLNAPPVIQTFIGLLVSLAVAVGGVAMAMGVLNSFAQLGLFKAFGAGIGATTVAVNGLNVALGTTTAISSLLVGGVVVGGLLALAGIIQAWRVNQAEVNKELELTQRNMRLNIQQMERSAQVAAQLREQGWVESQGVGSAQDLFLASYDAGWTRNVLGDRSISDVTATAGLIDDAVMKLRNQMSAIDTVLSNTTNSIAGSALARLESQKKNYQSVITQLQDVQESAVAAINHNETASSANRIVNFFRLSDGTSLTPEETVHKYLEAQSALVQLDAQITATRAQIVDVDEDALTTEKGKLQGLIDYLLAKKPTLNAVAGEIAEFRAGWVDAFAESSGTQQRDFASVERLVGNDIEWASSGERAANAFADSMNKNLRIARAFNSDFLDSSGSASWGRLLDAQVGELDRVESAYMELSQVRADTIREGASGIEEINKALDNMKGKYHELKGSMEGVALTKFVTEFREQRDVIDATGEALRAVGMNYSTAALKTKSFLQEIEELTQLISDPNLEISSLVTYKQRLVEVQEQLRSLNKDYEANSLFVEDFDSKFKELISNTFGLGGLGAAGAIITDGLAEMANIIGGVLTQSVYEMGYAWGYANDAMAVNSQRWADLAMSVAKAIPDLATSIGLQLLTTPMWPLGLALIAGGLIGQMSVGFAEGKIQSETDKVNGTSSFALGGAFTNSIVDTPTTFAFSRGTGLMGEAGAEAIMPLTRTADGSLGVQAVGGGANVEVNIFNNAGVEVKQEESTGPNGERQIQIFIEKAVQGVIASGKADKVMRGRYGVRVNG